MRRAVGDASLERYDGDMKKLDSDKIRSKTPSVSANDATSSKRIVKRKPGQAPDRTIRQRLRQTEKKNFDFLSEKTKTISKDLEKSGIEVLYTESEKAIRCTDSSEPPKILRDILFSDVPAIIAKPKNHEQVKTVVKLCRREGIPLVVRGAASSAFGGALPPEGGLVLDMGELAGIISTQASDLEITVHAGTRWANLALEMKKLDLALKTTPSSIFSTVAGWFSTGGYGINSLSYGHISNHVKKIRVVLPDGSDKYLTPKDRLFELMIGAEGQLGAITEMTLSIRPAPKFKKSLLIQTSDDEKAFKVIASLVGKNLPIAHIMFFDEGRTKEINDLSLIPGDPLHEMPAVLVQLEADDKDSLELKTPIDVSIGETPTFMANMLWGDRYFPMRGRIRGPGMLGAEVVLPMKSVPAYLSRVREVGKMFGVEIASEAHMISEKETLVLSFFLTDQRRSLMYTIHAVLSLLITRIGTDHKGRPYAIGIWNQPFAAFMISKEKMAELKKVNSELDPDDLFNPGKFLSKRVKLSGPIAVFLRERMTLFALGTLLAAASLAGRISRRFFSSRKDEGSSNLDLSAFACARCGACVNVCPAYLVTGRETVTGRGKLLIYRRMRSGLVPDKDEARELFLCMKCHACEEVCQTRLPLLSAYEELEDYIEELFGRPKDLIEKFVAEVEASPEYERMLYEGIISPDAAMKEGETDAV